MSDLVVNPEDRFSHVAAQIKVSYLKSSGDINDNWAATWENRIFAYAKTKTQISFAVTAKLISVFVFTTRIVHSLSFLNTKFQASRHFVRLRSLICVDLVGNPEDRFSDVAAQLRYWNLVSDPQNLAKEPEKNTVTVVS